MTPKWVWQKGMYCREAFVGELVLNAYPSGLWTIWAPGVGKFVRGQVDGRPTDVQEAAEVAARGIHRVVWPYDDCSLFERGDVVYYRNDGAEFWHPKNKTWMPSSRPNVLEDACSMN